MQVADQEKQKSMDLAEEAREKEWKNPSFIAEMFKGNFRWDLVHPFPLQDSKDKEYGDQLIVKAKEVLERTLDPDKVDQTYEYPKEALKALGEAGFFGMKISKDYGGLGLSQTNYGRIVAFIGTYCQSTATWLSAHQSIGVPQPLKFVGTPEQKKKYLPRLAAGEISAFALTEPGVGSDPAQMKTRADLTPDGKFYLINGEKLWITNGPDADILICMAQTTPKPVIDKKGKPVLDKEGKPKVRAQISAFIVDRKDPETAKGFEVAYRCRFMGLHGISNGLLRFKDMKVPAENLVGNAGEGLKIALMTLNSGRLTVPAIAGSASKYALHYAHKWCNTRVQWGAPIGKHQAVANMTSRMVAETFAMESMNWLACALADKGGVDIRLEAAMAKYFCTEAAWRVGDDFMQVRGGRGFESVGSLTNRGDEGITCERTMRDSRVARILEGTSEIMQLIIAREATDMHMSKVMPILNPKTPIGQKLSMAVKAAVFYATWFPTTFLPAFAPSNVTHLSAKNKAHLGYVARATKRLARKIFYPMAVYGPALERKTLILAHFVDVGTDLYTMTATLSHAEAIMARDGNKPELQDAVDLFCRIARRRIKTNFKLVWQRDHDNLIDKVGKNFFEGKYAWMTDGIYTDVPPKK